VQQRKQQYSRPWYRKLIRAANNYIQDSPALPIIHTQSHSVVNSPHIMKYLTGHHHASLAAMILISIISHLRKKGLGNLLPVWVPAHYLGFLQIKAYYANGPTRPTHFRPPGQKPGTLGKLTLTFGPWVAIIEQMVTTPYSQRGLK